jgi:hypothetical protein
MVDYVSAIPLARNSVLLRGLTKGDLCSPALKKRPAITGRKKSEILLTQSCTAATPQCSLADKPKRDFARKQRTESGGQLRGEESCQILRNIINPLLLLVFPPFSLSVFLF